ncbi:copper resistance D family protein [Paenibacillus sp. GCM10027627]|uniref:copper resistance D family protein n=1 Tax=unclassified Paenibacillus TaxID=185978 RepID=UPI003636F66B
MSYRTESERCGRPYRSVIKTVIAAIIVLFIVSSGLAVPSALAYSNPNELLLAGGHEGHEGHETSTDSKSSGKAKNDNDASALPSDDFEHDHDGGQRLMVVLRIIEVVTIIAVGAVFFFRYALWRKEQEAPPIGFTQNGERIVLAAAVLIFAITGLSRLDMLADQFEGVPWSDIASSTMVGKMAVLRPAAFIVMLLLAFAPQREQDWAVPVNGLLAIGVVITFPITGHAYALSQGVSAAIAAHSIHMATAAIWFGGLAGLWSMSCRSSLSGRLMPVANRFSLYALPSITVIVISGIWLTATQLPSWSSLWSSQYGKLAIAKSALLLLVVVIAAAHRLLRNKNSGSKAAVIGVRAEIVLAVALFAVAGWLSTTSPPPPEKAVLAAEPIYWHVMGDKAHMTLKIDPGEKKGEELVRLYVWLPEASGEPASASLRLTPSGLEIPISLQPLEKDPFSFPGFTKYTYLAEGDYLNAEFEGMLQVEITNQSGETFNYEKTLSPQDSGNS